MTLKLENPRQIPKAMCVPNTPVEHHLGLWVKREDLCCPGGPNFSKTRGVYAHVKSRPEAVIGVLDTYHSQGGWAVAKACSLLGKHCVLYYPVRKGHELDALRPQQTAAEALGAGLIDMPAGRSSILYHRAKADLDAQAGPDAYMMPNALKLSESVDETAAEFKRTNLRDTKTVLVSASSGTIAAGLVRAAPAYGIEKLVVHLGYSRSHRAVLTYLSAMSGVGLPWVQQLVTIVDENFTYADMAPDDVDLLKGEGGPPFPCNEYYDRKALRWWLMQGRNQLKGEVLFWNIG